MRSAPAPDQREPGLSLGLRERNPTPKKASARRASAPRRRRRAPSRERRSRGQGRCREHVPQMGSPPREQRRFEPRKRSRPRESREEDKRRRRRAALGSSRSCEARRCSMLRRSHSPPAGPLLVARPVRSLECRPRHDYLGLAPPLSHVYRTHHAPHRDLLPTLARRAPQRSTS